MLHLNIFSVVQMVLARPATTLTPQGKEDEEKVELYSITTLITEAKMFRHDFLQL